MNIKKFTFFAIFSAMMLLTGCASTHKYHSYQPLFTQGNELTASKLNAVKIGMTKEQVEVVLGTPVMTNVLNSNQWNYIYTYQQGKKVLDSRYAIITFKNGKVSNIQKNLHAANIQPVKTSKHHWL